MIYLVKYWKEAALVLLVIALFGTWRSRENGLVEKGKAQERARVADSILAVVTPQRLKAETLLVRDTLRLRQTVERVVSLRDTLLVRLTDTLIVKQFVARTDSALAVCNDLARDCGAFRLSANATIQALQQKLAAQPAMQRRSCAMPMMVSALAGGVGGYAVAARR